MKGKKDIESGLAEAQFAAQAKAHFDDSVQRLDAATQSRLNRGRQQALAEVAAGTRFGRWNQWLPLAGVAAAAVFAVVLWRGNTQVDEPLAAPAVADFELLLDQDDFEMLQDLEFYSWIEIDDDSGANVG
jgi:hypothetical protein